MPDKKEIIIDYINVNECEFYGYAGVCKLYSGSVCSKDCSNYPNCNYKQLKRAKQECETLATQLDFEVQKRKCLEQECEKLKAIVTEAEEAPICFHCSEEPCIRQERDKYKQSLDEIDNLISPCCPELYKTCLECDKYTCTFRKIKDILDIINKVKR